MAHDFPTCIEHYLIYKGWSVVTNEKDNSVVWFVKANIPVPSSMSPLVSITALHVQLIVDVGESGNIDEFANFVKDWNL